MPNSKRVRGWISGEGLAVIVSILLVLALVGFAVYYALQTKYQIENAAKSLDRASASLYAEGKVAEADKIRELARQAYAVVNELNND